MILTAKQEEGLKIAVARYKANEKYTIISGYAGTGKSTLVRFIIDALDVAPSKVAYATFTGKAAEVLRKKGNANAMTLHRLLYDHFPREGGGFFRKPKKHLEYNIIVVDEISMVPQEMIELLFSHRCYVIGLGDPFQLPPICEEDNNRLLEKPHVFLDEIMRQAAESEIIQLSMDIRNYKPLKLYKGNEVQVLSPKEVNTGMLLWADQILVATNLKRELCNKTIRQLLGYGEEPEEGEKVVCLHNYWEDLSEGGDALVNGTIGILEAPTVETITFPRWTRTIKKNVKAITANIVVDNDIYSCVNIDRKKLMTEEKSLDWRDEYKLSGLKYKIGDLVPKEFVYAYAITCHKAQGSQWPKILVFEERFPFNKEEHARWLYTAVTRAEEKIVLIRNE